MKKIFVLLFLFLNLHTKAQEEFRNQCYFGISQGLNISRLNLDPSIQGMFDLSTDQNFELGYVGGIVFLYYSEPHKGIQMELNYSQRGWSEDLDSSNSYCRKLDYLEFPFLSHFDIGLRNLNLSITVGPTISYLISSQEVTHSIDEDKLKSYYNIEIDNKLEGDLCIGVGVNKFTRNGILQLECRLNQGFSNIFSEERILDFSTSQNQVIGIKISYLFNMKKNHL